MIQIRRLWYVVFSFLFILNTLPIVAYAGAKELIIDSFEAKTNDLNGETGIYYKKPSRISTRKVFDTLGEGVTTSLELTYDRKTEGWCGYYSTLLVGDRYFDASGCDSVILWVKGAEGGESFVCGLADEKWLEKDDTLKSGPIEIYLAEGVTKEWQKVIIPLSDFGDLDLTKLASFVIQFDIPGEGTIRIENLGFKKER